MTQKVWIAGNYVEGNVDWRLLGVFTTEAIAVDACVDNHCFVAEIPVNQELKSGRFENMCYPKKAVVKKR